MINGSKTTEFSATHQMVAGILQSDENIEFAGVTDVKQVIWLRNGSSHYFTDLPLRYYNLLKEAYLKDSKAVRFLSAITSVQRRQVELYTYYTYGDLDSTPDILNGKLTEPENFRDSEDCPSQLWDSKNITIDGKALTPREILISDMFGKDLPDKAIASTLSISHSHFDVVKRNLFKKADVLTKTAYVMKAMTQKVIRR